MQLAPVSPDLTGLTGKTVDIARPDVLRELVVDNFRTNTSVWEFSAQLCADLKTMPIDDPTKRWDEASSPFIAVRCLVREPPTLDGLKS